MQLNPLPGSNPIAIACDYNAIAPESRTTHTATVETIFASVLAIEELSHGYAFELPLETPLLYKVSEFIANERLCCPFFTFTLVVGDSLWLKLTGADEVKGFIKMNIVDALQQTGTLPDPDLWIATHTIPLR